MTPDERTARQGEPSWIRGLGPAFGIVRKAHLSGWHAALNMQGCLSEEECWTLHVENEALYESKAGEAAKQIGD